MPHIVMRMLTVAFASSLAVAVSSVMEEQSRSIRKPTKSEEQRRQRMNNSFTSSLFIDLTTLRLLLLAGTNFSILVV